MARAKMEFKKGDAVTHYFQIPTASWSAGGTLLLAAKPVPDDDATDTAAVIDKSFDDTDVSDVTVDGVAYKQYECGFVAADTNNISFADGSKKKKYLGEFQFVPATGSPSTFPGDGSFLEVTVYADIKRGIS